ncbi:MAG: hypothetical protein K2K64_01860 [Muribaculaceae bacterium]|nr:hypothetical protein [Muribaculaceae bacterium]
MRIKSLSNYTRLLPAALMLAGATAFLFSACKGRTAKDVVPTGDTVEVVFGTTEADSISNQTVTDSLNNEI